MTPLPWQSARTARGRRALLRQLLALGLSAPTVHQVLAQAGLASAASEPPYAPTRAGGGGTLKLLFWQGPTLLNPHLATGAKDVEAARLFYEPLVRHDAEGRMVPVLAAEVPSHENGGIARDGGSITWRLKPGVRWHDGRPFGADDVVFTWRHAVDPASASMLAGAYANVRRIEKLDELTVRVVLDQPSPVWHRGATVMLLPRHLFEPYTGARAREAPANLKPVGTGPYRDAEFMPGDLLKAVRNPAYHRPHRPHFDRVELKGGGDAVGAARAVLQGGEYDFAWNLQVDDVLLAGMEAGGKGRVTVQPSGNVEVIMLNFADPWRELDGERAHPDSRHPVFHDARVRQALTLLFDRRNVQAHVYGRTGTATANLLHNPARYNSPRTVPPASLEQANTLLDAAGWVRGTDGMRARDGRRLALVFQTSINPLRQKVQSIFKQACQQAGIELELKAVQSAVFFSSAPGNPDTAGRFLADLQMVANSARDPDPDRYMQWFVSWECARQANQWTGLNRNRYQDPAYDRLYRASSRELDPVARTAQLIRLNDLVSSSGWFIPVVNRPSVHGVVNGLVAPTTGWDQALSAIADWHRTP